MNYIQKKRVYQYSKIQFVQTSFYWKTFGSNLQHLIYSSQTSFKRWLWRRRLDYPICKCELKTLPGVWRLISVNQTWTLHDVERAKFSGQRERRGREGYSGIHELVKRSGRLWCWSKNARVPWSPYSLPVIPAVQMLQVWTKHFLSLCTSTVEKRNSRFREKLDERSISGKLSTITISVELHKQFVSRRRRNYNLYISNFSESLRVTKVIFSQGFHLFVRPSQNGKTFSKWKELHGPPGMNNVLIPSKYQFISPTPPEKEHSDSALPTKFNSLQPTRKKVSLNSPLPLSCSNKLNRKNKQIFQLYRALRAGHRRREKNCKTDGGKKSSALHVTHGRYISQRAIHTYTHSNLVPKENEESVFALAHEASRGMVFRISPIRSACGGGACLHVLSRYWFSPLCAGGENTRRLEVVGVESRAWELSVTSVYRIPERAFVMYPRRDNDYLYRARTTCYTFSGIFFCSGVERGGWMKEQENPMFGRVRCMCRKWLHFFPSTFNNSVSCRTADFNFNVRFERLIKCSWLINVFDGLCSQMGFRRFYQRYWHFFKALLIPHFRTDKIKRILFP